MKKNLILMGSAAIIAMSGSLALAELGDASKLPAASDKKVDFKKDIWPIFEEKCISCHGPEKQKSKYRMDSREETLKGGSSGDEAIIPGNSAKSPFIHYCARLVEDMEMPPKEKDALSKEQIALLRAWVDQGAKW